MASPVLKPDLPNVKFSLMANMMKHKTIRDAGVPTVREQNLSETGASAPGEQSRATSPQFSLLPEGLRLVSRLSTRGSEADLYIVDEGGETRVLKMYRQGARPKQDVLEKYEEISSACPEHVIKIFRSGWDARSGRWYEIQELARRGSVADWLSDGLPFDFEALVSQLAGAVHALHQRGVIHRDLKPGNILVRSDAPLDLALTDFGVASILESGLELRETLHKGFTPMYAAPEDFDGGIVSAAADWWACGMIFLEVLAGAHPFQGLSPARIAYFLATRGVSIDPSLPERPRQLLKGLLTRNDKRRWGWREIQAWLAGRTDIPTHYENPAAEEAVRSFRFLGKSFASPREMALYFASDYEAWKAGRGTLARGNIAKWLADCREYEEERIVADELADNDADFYLARFIAHYAPELAPGLFGLALSARSLLACLGRPEKERSEAETAFAAFVVERKGGLKKLLDIWSGAGGKAADPVLAALADVDWGSPEELRNGLLALLAPESFYWGPGGFPQSCKERLDFLAATPEILTMKSWEEMDGPNLPLTPRIIRLFENGHYKEAIASLRAVKKRLLTEEDYAFIRQLAKEYGLNERWVDFLEEALELLNRHVREKAESSPFASTLERGLNFFSEANTAHALLRRFVEAALGRSGFRGALGPMPGDSPFSFGGWLVGPFSEILSGMGENGAAGLNDEPFASLFRLLEEMGLRRS